MTEVNQKKRLSEELWLGYFNETLFKKSIITELERNKMTLRISNRKQMPIRKAEKTAR